MLLAVGLYWRMRVTFERSLKFLHCCLLHYQENESPLALHYFKIAKATFTENDFNKLYVQAIQFLDPLRNPHRHPIREALESTPSFDLAESLRLKAQLTDRQFRAWSKFDHMFVLGLAAEPEKEEPLLPNN